MPYKRISVDEAKSIIKEKNAIVADIRDAGAYSQGHIKDSINVSDKNIDSFLKDTDKEKPLVVYCYKGFSSRDAADYFAKNGFKEVYSMDGGFDAWKE